MTCKEPIIEGLTVTGRAGKPVRMAKAITLVVGFLFTYFAGLTNKNKEII
ncbi:MAG TPA: hypothetical protein VJH06_00085 [Candidatus Paceibacterota bacterium]